MEIRKIKVRAKQVLNMNKFQYQRVLLMVVLLELIPNLFSTGEDLFSRLIYMIISIAFLTVSHGYIISSLKMVRNQSMMLNDDDAFVGFKRFKGLFSTYLLVDIFTVGLSMLAGLVLMAILAMFISGASSQIDNQVVALNNYAQIFSYVSNLPVSVLATIFLFYILLIALVFIISSYFFAVPYLLERYRMTNMHAIKASLSLMKGHIFDYIKLTLSFLGWMLAIIIIQVLLENLLAFLPILGSLIAAIVAGFISVYTYLPKYTLSQAIFFEELAYYRYEQNQSYNGDDQYV